MPVVDDFHDIVYQIPRAKRLMLAEKIASVQAALGSTVDLLADRRSTNWSEDGKARKTVKARSQPFGRPPKENYRVTWRDGFGSTVHTLDDAAAQVGKTPASLRTAVALSRTGRITLLVDEERIVTVEKL